VLRIWMEDFLQLAQVGLGDGEGIASLVPPLVTNCGYACAPPRVVAAAVTSSLSDRGCGGRCATRRNSAFSALSRSTSRSKALPSNFVTGFVTWLARGRRTRSAAVIAFCR
jgi:hypothetical protein